MTNHFWLYKKQLAWLKPYFPLSHWMPRVDDRKVVNGIIHVIRNRLRWQDTPDVYGPYKTLCNRVIRCSKIGVFDYIFAALVAKNSPPDRLMIDATHLIAHRTACSLVKGGCSPRYRPHQGRAEL
jgi:transposase